MNGLNARQRIEAAYHDRWAVDIEADSLLVEPNFMASTAVENRFILEYFGDLSGKKLLDVGCGAGESSIYFARQGAHVTAIDISEGQLGVARKFAADCNVEVAFHQLPLERIDSLNASFDLIYGNGVLHHVDLYQSARALAAVLRPNGKGAFIEPLSHNPIIWLYRKMAAAVRTPTERPLYIRDVEIFREFFTGVMHREFWLLSAAVFVLFLLKGINPSKVRYWKRVITAADEISTVHKHLFRLDRFLLQKVPKLGRYCWNTVVYFQGSRYGK